MANCPHSIPKRVLALLGTLVLAGASQADVIHDNGSALENSGMWSEQDRFLDSTSGITWLIQAGDSFSLAAPATLGAVRWWGWNSGPNPDQANAFTLSLYSFVGNAPSELAFHSAPLTTLTRTAVGDFAGSFEYAATVAPVSLAANTPYLLSIVNDFGTPGDLSDAWVWRRSSDGPDDRHSARQSTTTIPGPWIVDGFGHDLAFQLSAPVPEPDAALLLGVGLLGLLAAGRTRRSVV